MDSDPDFDDVPSRLEFSIPIIVMVGLAVAVGILVYYSIFG